MRILFLAALGVAEHLIFAVLGAETNLDFLHATDTESNSDTDPAAAMERGSGGEPITFRWTQYRGAEGCVEENANGEFILQPGVSTLLTDALILSAGMQVNWAEIKTVKASFNADHPIGAGAKLELESDRLFSHERNATETFTFSGECVHIASFGYHKLEWGFPTRGPSMRPRSEAGGQNGNPGRSVVVQDGGAPLDDVQDQDRGSGGEPITLRWTHYRGAAGCVEEFVKGEFLLQPGVSTLLTDALMLSAGMQSNWAEIKTVKASFNADHPMGAGATLELESDRLISHERNARATTPFKLSGECVHIPLWGYNKLEWGSLTRRLSVRAEDARPADGDECAICLAALEQNGTGDLAPKKRARCCHIFHTDCIRRWAEQSPACPLCRVEES